MGVGGEAHSTAMAAKRLPHARLRLRIRRWIGVWVWVGLQACLAPVTPAAEIPSALRAYAVTTETGMPHLEENLRYAVVRETRCLDPHDPGAVFWMLRHEALQDCRLERTPTPDANADADADAALSAHYTLICTGGHGTTGNAVWELAPEALRGTLSVRLGGKNMTFYQRIVARPVGACAAR